MNHGTPTKSGSTLNGALGAVAATVLSLVLGLIFLGSKSFWLDESFSAAASRLGLHDLLRLAADSQANMSLYYLVLHGWRVFGDGESELRLLSVLFAAAAVPVVWAVAQRLFDPLTAAISAFLLAGNQFLVQYAQEARGYALAVFLASLASLLFLRAVERPTVSRLSLYAVVGGVGLYAHLYVSLVLLAHLCASMLLARNRMKLVPAFLGIGLLAVPMVLFVLFRDSGQISYLSAPGVVALVKTLAHLGGGRTTFLVLGLLAAVGLVRNRRTILSPRTDGGWPWAFVLLWVGLPIVVSFLASQAKPFFQPFYLIVCLPAVVILVARGLVSLPGNRLRVMAGTVVVALSLAELVLWYGYYEKEDWRGVQKYVATQAHQGDAIAFYAPYVRVPFEYYELRNETHRLRPVHPGAPWSRLSLLHATLGQDSVAFAPSLFERSPRTWIILSHGDPMKDRQLLAAARAANSRSHATQFEGAVVVLVERRK